MEQQPSKSNQQWQREGNSYRFNPVKLKTWLENQAGSRGKHSEQNDSTAKGGQKEE